MEILNKFGFDPIMLAAQIVNFLIILYLLKRFLYKPVFKILKERQDKIEEGIKQTEKAQKTLEEAIGKETRILANAKKEAQMLIENAKSDSLELARQIEENAKTEVEGLINEAKAKISLESEIAEKKLSEHASALATSLLKKTLQDEIDKHGQRKIMENAFKKINKK
ncbi:MAG: ATP synthase F0 subunit B [Candidatus Levybacteria bacterium RIFCSPLOWO2_01_FULL_36_13]|nr:MAG: ATP synthase F0 subunit B [Candidatus Levybacteria bacterium RIFCSPHIGHO2_01_FULL_36_15b]OGH35574.1 MAG: ATP synthase F0 subunit B [Candidatus Levybacteria bacterium RIFCSPLOWO2_01_FULL_36_13]